MNIIFAKKEDAQQLSDKYTILELDTFRMPGIPDPLTAWCIIDLKSIALQDIPEISQFRDLHNNLMKNYRLRNWRYCEDALEHLVGKWRGDLDSFYDDIKKRIVEFKISVPDDNWSGILDRSSHPISMSSDQTHQE